ncbi:unnamed protein product [Rotaria sp. Silwood2]|nr:unnamed protein product [Rotaria sp. Silwood2]CAF4009836.1 unnamed protein product [Rotaria sp. Silwood2]
MVINTTTSQKITIQRSANSTLTTMHKSKQSTGARKRTMEISSNGTTLSSLGQDTVSDISGDDAENPIPLKKRRVSIVHTYAHKLSDLEYQCLLCMKIIRCSIGSNSNIKRHLIQVHGLNHLKSKSDPSVVPKRLFDPFRKVTLDEAAIKCIVVDSRPFGDFRKKGMLHFLSTALPGYVGPHANTVRQTMKHLYANKLLKLREDLKQIPYVSLTTDLWRRPRKHHYLCVTIHYVDTNYLNVSKVLSFRRFHGRHFGQRIRNHLIRVVNNFQLESKIVAIVSDNGSDMHFATQYPEMFGVRLHCLTHALNLTVANGLQLWKKKDKKQDSTTDLTKPHDDGEIEDADGNEVEEESSDESDEEEEEISTTLNADDNESNIVIKHFDLDEEGHREIPQDNTDILSSDEDMDDDNGQILDSSTIINNINDVLSNCRKIINTINRSSILYEIIHNLARPSINADLILDMQIRWNSTFKMTSRLVQYRSILNTFMEQLSSIDGVTSKQRNKLIKSQISNAEWDILNTLNSTLSIFSDASVELSGSGYPSFSTAYVICSFLNPVVFDIMDEHDRLSAKKLLMTDTHMKRNVNQENKTVPASSISTTTDTLATITTSTTNLSPAERLKLFRAKCGIAQPLSTLKKSKTVSLKQEIAKFETLDKDEHSFSTFWKKYERSLPLLSKMARRYGSITASSVPSESSFSIAGYLARKNRSSLSAKNLKYSMFLKDKI